MTEQRTPELIQREFSAQIARYRSRTLRTWALIIVVGIGALVLGSLHVPLLVLYVVAAGLAVWGMWLIGLYFRSGLQCPNCRHGLDLSIDEYCPACGSNAGMISEGVPRKTRCPSCNARLDVDRVNGRSWTIRFCTFCGMLLSEPGV